MVVVRNFAALADHEKNVATFLNKKLREGWELVSMSREGLQHQFVFKTSEAPLEASLRRVIDDLWACIGVGQIADLQPETVEACKANHGLLWHA